MSSTERALVFTCHGQSLIGILAEPASNVQPSAVLIVVGGPQYRAGSHRHFVQLSRELANAGHPTLRFDVRGMGDSEGDMRSFESITDDIESAVDTLVANTAASTRVLLWGLCDGASAALLYLEQRRDPRVGGLCLLNPWVRSEQSQARTQVKHYYLGRLQQREFWRKLMTGQVAVSALGGLARSVKLAVSASVATPSQSAIPYQARMAKGWAESTGPILLLLSGNDYTAKEFLEFTRGDARWQLPLASARVSRHELPDADHTFSETADKKRVTELTVAWARSACLA